MQDLQTEVQKYKTKFSKLELATGRTIKDLGDDKRALNDKINGLSKELNDLSKANTVQTVEMT